MDQPNAVAEWYKDPTGRFEYRYWDGQLWTENVATGGTASLDPLIDPTPDVRPTAEPQAPAQSVPAAAVEQVKVGAFAKLKNERRARLEGRSEFESLAMLAATGDADAFAQLPAALIAAKDLWRGGKFDEMKWKVMATAVRHVLDDDILSATEEDHLDKLGEELGTPVQSIAHRDFPLFEELAIAGINDGRFPRLPNPPIMLKGDEVAYGSFGVALMKEVTLREFHGGSQSVSVPLGGGFRYRVGGMRGKSVVVGTQMVAQDSGLLVVTSTRAMFVGHKKTLEFRFDKLVSLEQYSDGLQLNVSNRQAVSLFTMQAGQSASIAAALLSAATAHR